MKRQPLVRDSPNGVLTIKICVHQADFVKKRLQDVRRSMYNNDVDSLPQAIKLASCLFASCSSTIAYLVLLPFDC